MFNETYFSEGVVVDAFFDKCTTAVMFDCGGEDTATGSYDRGDFTIKINQGTASFNGVVFQNGAQLVGGRLRIFGNFETSASPLSSAVLTLTGVTPPSHTDAGDPSKIEYAELDINVEPDGGLANAPMTINYEPNPPGTVNLIRSCSGNISFGPSGLFTPSNATSPDTQFAFQGPVIGDPVLQAAPPSGISGTFLCPPAQYAPATVTTLTVTGTTLTAFSSANVNTGSFIAPASGSVVVTATFSAGPGAAGTVMVFGIAAHGTTTPAANLINFADSAVETRLWECTWVVTGLTAGSSYNFDLIGANQTSADTVTIRALGVTAVGTTEGSPVIMTVRGV
jgi:hypothetical protein